LAFSNAIAETRHTLHGYIYADPSRKHKPVGIFTTGETGLL